MIIQALLDYAKAHKTLVTETSPADKKAAAGLIVAEVDEFFSNARQHPYLELSEFDIVWLQTAFSDLKNDPERLDAVTKLRFLG